MDNPIQGILAGVQRQQQKFIADILDQKPRKVYRMDDYSTMRSLIYQNVLQAVKQRFPLYNNKYLLDVQDLDYQTPQTNDYKAQKQAILNGKSLGRKLKGSFVLKDATTQKVISKGKRQTILTVPHMTDRGTFINSGSQYALINIMRLQPGVYTKKNTDNQISAQFNVKKGTGAGFNMKFVPSRGLFYMNRGTANAPAYTVLKDLGVTDQQMRQSWGQELYNKNKQAGLGQKARIAADRIYNYKG